MCGRLTASCHTSVTRWSWWLQECMHECAVRIGRRPAARAGAPRPAPGGRRADGVAGPRRRPGVGLRRFPPGSARRREYGACQRRDPEAAAPGRLPVRRHPRSVRLPFSSGAEAPGGLALSGSHLHRASAFAGVDPTARFITAQHLANQLGRSSTSLGRQRLLRPLLACDLLVLDELGYLPTLPGFGPALYELIAGRYERRPTLITSNKSLTDWAAIVQDASLAAALVDRILHHGDVFYLKGPSWRVKGRSPDDAGKATTEAGDA